MKEIMHTNQRQVGETASPITLPAIDGSIFDSRTFAGHAYLVSFFRFAGCPFCNMRIHDMVEQFSSYGNGIKVVAIFDSPLDNLIHHAQKHQAPFPILADEENIYYQKYGIPRSMAGVLKGMVLRMPTLVKGISKGYIPTTIKGSMTTMPADFLVDKQGVIQVAHYGQDEGDHLPFEQIRAFALSQSQHQTGKISPTSLANQ